MQNSLFQPHLGLSFGGVLRFPGNITITSSLTLKVLVENINSAKSSKIPSLKSCKA